MAKSKISDYNSNPVYNTDIAGIDIDEGCAPSGINNAIRTVMGQLKDFQTGSQGDSFTVGGNLSVTGTTTLGTATAPTVSSSDNSTNIATTAFVTTKVGTLGTMASQNANAVTITGGTIIGTTVNSVTVGTNASGSKTISSSAPSGGSSGDIWYQI
jgi:hypothetical protein